MHDQARVDAAGEKGTEWHIRDELLLDGFREKHVEFCERRFGARLWGADGPVLLHFRLVVLPLHPMRGRKLAYRLEKAVWRERGLEREVVAQRLVIELAGKALEREEGSEGGREHQASVRGIEERLDAEAITRGEEAPLACVPDRESEDAVEARRHAAPPFDEAAQDDFGVRARREGMAARFELGAQLAEVIDLAVVGDDVSAALDCHRLATAGEGDDREPRMPERGVRVAPSFIR